MKRKKNDILRMHNGIDGRCLQALIYTFSLMLMHTKRQNAITKKRTPQTENIPFVLNLSLWLDIRLLAVYLALHLSGESDGRKRKF